MVTVIGNLLFHAKKSFIEKTGNEKFEKVLSLLDNDAREIFSGLIISTHTYELKHFQAFLDASYKVLTKNDFYLVMGNISEQQLSGLFGFFVKFLSPETVIRKGQSMWSKVYSEGKVEVIESNDKNVKLKISEFSFSEGHLVSSDAYFKKLIEIVHKNKVSSSSYKRIDPRTTEFSFVF